MHIINILLYSYHKQFSLVVWMFCICMIIVRVQYMFLFNLFNFIQDSNN